MENIINMKVYMPNDKGFEKICDYLEENVCKENLSWNGGTLNYENLTYDSDILFVAYDKKVPIGYTSLIITEMGIYVYQIAIKKEYQQRGIGSSMMQMTLDFADSNNMDVSAHVRDYNSNSLKMFTRLGFKKISEKDGNYFLLLEQTKKDKNVSK